MAGEKKHTIQTVRNAIYAAYGIKIDIARRLKVVRQTLDNYLAEWPELQADMTQARGCLLDEAESALMKRIKKGDTKAIIFALETLGRERGYVRRSEVTGKDGRPITFNLEVITDASQIRTDAP